MSKMEANNTRKTKKTNKNQKMKLKQNIKLPCNQHD